MGVDVEAELEPDVCGAWWGGVEIRFGLSPRSGGRPGMRHAFVYSILPKHSKRKAMNRGEYGRW